MVFAKNLCREYQNSQPNPDTGLTPPRRRPRQAALAAKDTTKIQAAATVATGLGGLRPLKKSAVKQTSLC